MKLADSSVWLALALSAHYHHAAASAWLVGQPDDEEVAFCHLTQLALLRLLTTGAVLNVYGNRPLTNEQAWQVYEGFLGDQRIGYAEEPPGLQAQWERLGVRQTASPKLWMDAYLAAFAIAGGHQLVTIDGAYRQFAGLDAVILKRA